MAGKKKAKRKKKSREPSVAELMKVWIDADNFITNFCNSFSTHLAKAVDEEICLHGSVTDSDTFRKKGRGC